MHVADRMLQMFKSPPTPRFPPQQDEINGLFINTCHTAQINQGSVGVCTPSYLIDTLEEEQWHEGRWC